MMPTNGHPDFSGGRFLIGVAYLCRSLITHVSAALLFNTTSVVKAAVLVPLPNFGCDERGALSHN